MAWGSFRLLGGFGLPGHFRQTAFFGWLRAAGHEYWIARSVGSALTDYPDEKYGRLSAHRGELLGMVGLSQFAVPGSYGDEATARAAGLKVAAFVAADPALAERLQSGEEAVTAEQRAEHKEDQLGKLKTAVGLAAGFATLVKGGVSKLGGTSTPAPVGPTAAAAGGSESAGGAPGGASIFPLVMLAGAAGVLSLGVLYVAR